MSFNTFAYSGTSGVDLTPGGTFFSQSVSGGSLNRQSVINDNPWIATDLGRLRIPDTLHYFDHDPGQADYLFLQLSATDFRGYYLDRALLSLSWTSVDASTAFYFEALGADSTGVTLRQALNGTLGGLLDWTAAVNIQGSVGDDKIGLSTGGGNAVGGDGNDTLLGGSGYSTLHQPEIFDSQLYGGAGDDKFITDGDTFSNGDVGNDTFASGAHDDSAIGGDGDDRYYGSAGWDFFEGGNGNDTVDMRSVDFTVDHSHTQLYASGSPLFSGHIADDPDGVDIILMPTSAGSISDFAMYETTDPNGNDYVKLVYRGSETDLQTHFGIEAFNFDKMTFHSGPMNIVGLRGPNDLAHSVAELAAIDAKNTYGAGANATADIYHGWLHLIPLVLSMKSHGSDGQGGKYYFDSGRYTDYSAGLGLFLPSTAGVDLQIGNLNGKRTLSVTFKGSDNPLLDPLDWYYDIGKVIAPTLISDYYKKYKPVVDGLKGYLAVDGQFYDQILVSGHSLGGAMVQQFIADLAPTYGSKLVGYTFGSIGDSTTQGSVSGKVVNFIHTNDLARLGLNGLGDTHGGAEVFLNSATVSVFNPFAQHSVDGYAKDLLNLSNIAYDSGDAFYATALAQSIRNGTLYTGPTIQVGPGSQTADQFVGLSKDNFVDMAEGADTYVLLRSNVPASSNAGGSRVVDGGYDGPTPRLDRVLIDGYVSEFTFTQLSGGAVALSTKAGSSFGSTAHYVATLTRIDYVEFRDDIVFLNGHQAKIGHLPGSNSGSAVTTSPPTYNIDHSYDYTEAGDGAMTVIGTSFDDVVFAGRGDKTLYGMAGNDTISVRPPTGAVSEKIYIDGGTGADVMIGSQGSETFVVDNDLDVALGGGGHDAVISSALTYVLMDGVEDLVLRSGALAGSGNELANQVLGNTAANTLFGGAANDTVQGGAGADSLMGDAGDDQLSGGTENDTLNGGAGKDILDGGAGQDTATYADKSVAVALTLNGTVLATAAVGGVAEDQIKNIEDVIGGSAGDSLVGDLNANTLDGYDGNDRLVGNNGYDTLVGGEGNDTMDGGLGKDRLDGGNGADAFRFSTALSPSNVDLIVGFSHVDDRIQLDSAIFSALGLSVTNSEFHINASGHGAGTSVVRLILDDSTHTLWYDDDGNGAHAAVQVCGFSGTVGTLAFDDFVI